MSPRVLARALGAALAAAALAVPATALGVTRPRPARAPVQALGTLVQLPAASGCLADRSARARARGCTPVRALDGPGPFVGSHAVAVSADGRNVYVAASGSDAIAIFERNARTGRLTQAGGRGGCIAARGAGGCATAIGLDGPNSVAVSPDGTTVYATALKSDSVVALRRDPSTGALAQATDGSGCVAGQAAISGCGTARALSGPDVVAVSPDGRNVYVGAFAGNAVLAFARDAAGGLTQLADTAGCLVDAPTTGCATGVALKAPEGLAISDDGSSVYVASAGSNALLTLARDPSTGALAQAADGSGCIAGSPLAGCTTGVWLAGANAVAVSPGGDDVYVTSLGSDSVTAFTRDPSDGRLTQQSGTSACVIHVLAVGCSLGRALDAPEGLAVSPDGATVYAAAFGTGAVDVLDRSSSGALRQKPRRAGCVTARILPDCTRGRALSGASSVAVSPDGRHVYATAFRSDAVDVFKRIARSAIRGQR
jgi:DNA-binding beta-propeller fold protein YncE